jgi:protein SCO1/2
VTVCRSANAPNFWQGLRVPVPGRRLLLGLSAILVVAVVVLVFGLLRGRADPKLEDYGEVPAFSLVDESGQPFTESALRGHPTVFSFIFTRCDAICPTTSGLMEHIQEKTFGDNVKLVSVSVDPQYDTPQILAAYAKRFHADPTRWHFITGPYDQVHALVEGPMMISMMRTPDKGGVPQIAHQGLFLLVDGNLHIRGTYDYNDLPRLDALVRDARFLARTGK